MSQIEKIIYYFLSNKQDILKYNSFHGLPYCCAVATKYTKGFQILSVWTFVTLCVRHGVYVRLFDQSGHDILMRVRPLNMCAPLSAPSRSPSKIRLDRPFFSTNQSTGIAYFTGCTYAFRPIRARPWRTSRGVRTRFNNQSVAMAYVTGCTYAFRPESERGVLVY